MHCRAERALRWQSSMMMICSRKPRCDRNDSKLSWFKFVASRRATVCQTQVLARLFSGYASQAVSWLASWLLAEQVQLEFFSHNSIFTIVIVNPLHVTATLTDGWTHWSWLAFSLRSVLQTSALPQLCASLWHIHYKQWCFFWTAVCLLLLKVDLVVYWIYSQLGCSVLALAQPCSSDDSENQRRRTSN